MHIFRPFCFCLIACRQKWNVLARHWKKFYHCESRQNDFKVEGWTCQPRDFLSFPWKKELVDQTPVLCIFQVHFCNKVIVLNTPACQKLGNFRYKSVNNSYRKLAKKVLQKKQERGIVPNFKAVAFKRKRKLLKGTQINVYTVRVLYSFVQKTIFNSYWSKFSIT